MSRQGNWGATPPECTCCKRVLNPEKMVALELDRRTDTYHNLGGVPDSESQGWFDFGAACARRKLREHQAAISEAVSA